MAVWKKENNVLTNRGNEILSLVSSGFGKLTVTRISSGSGFTPLTDLRGLTNVNTVKQNLELVRTQLAENGSVLSVRLSNTDLAEAYTLSQIGVFVTHPNFSGEQLYMIAQCEQASADFIPLPSDSPVTVNYSLSLVHGALENLEITVNEADVALQADLDALDDAVLHRVGGEMLNTNLVQNLNADLLDGKQGSEYLHREGYAQKTEVIPNLNANFLGGKQSSEYLIREGYEEKTEVIPNLNANFLNGKASTDFAEQEHNHGNITKDGKMLGYTPDLLLGTGLNGHIVTKTPAEVTALIGIKPHQHGNITNDGKVGTDADKILVTTAGGIVNTKTPAEVGSLIGISNPNILHNWDFRNPVNQRGVSEVISTPGYFFDRWLLVDGSVTVNEGYLWLDSDTIIEQRIEGQYLAGKTVTISFMSGPTIYNSGTGVFPVSQGGNVVTTSIGTTLLGYDELGYMVVRFTASGGRAIVAAKLELGTVSTLHLDPPMDYAVELPKCQRFCLYLSSSVIMAGYSYNATVASVLYPTSVMMRANPTMSPTVQIRTLSEAGSSNTTISSITALNTGVRFNVTGSGYGAWRPVNGMLLENSLLSADL